MKETNMEHFRSEIENANYKFGVVCGQVVKCYAERCPHCDFFGKKQCIKGAVEWLMSEYKPEPVLTQKEKHFVEFAQEGWLVRDRDGAISFYKSQRPVKVDVRWRPFDPETYMPDCGDFPFITWEDEEPWAVADLRKLKVGDQDA